MRETVTTIVQQGVAATGQETVKAAGFFRELLRQGANWREFGPEKRWCESIVL
jgi:hypothetical protein